MLSALCAAGRNEGRRADAAGIFTVENLGHMWVCSARLFRYGMQFHQLYKSHYIETFLLMAELAIDAEVNSC